MTRNRILTALCFAFAAACVPAICGCGALVARPADFDNAETGEEGEIYVLDDLREIANDPRLTEEEKRAAFHELGIEDEDLIEALLTLDA